MDFCLLRSLLKRSARWEQVRLERSRTRRVGGGTGACVLEGDGGECPLELENVTVRLELEVASLSRPRLALEYALSSRSRLELKGASLCSSPPESGDTSHSRSRLDLENMMSSRSLLELAGRSRRRGGGDGVLGDSLLGVTVESGRVRAMTDSMLEDSRWPLGKRLRFMRSPILPENPPPPAQS